jgi:hypothetical protein
VALLLAGEPAGAGQDAPPAAAAAAEEHVPAAAAPLLAEGETRYRAGDCAGALESFRGAEAAGARSGLLFYQIGYCRALGGDAEGGLEAKRRAVPYFERSIEAGRGGIDPYYYLAAICFNDLQDRGRAVAVAQRGMAAHASGAFGPLGGEELFRLGRLIGFVLDADPQHADPALVRRQTAAYRQAADVLRRSPAANRPYLILAATTVAERAREAGSRDVAIRYYGYASNADPMQEPPARALLGIALEAVSRGDLRQAADAWAAIRGPGDAKTTAQYGLRLARKALEHPAPLPDSLAGAPIASLDRAALERGLLAAADVLRAAARAAAEAVSDESVPDAEEVERQGALFLALALAYLRQGHDIRMFVLSNQLTPLIFR